MSTYDVFMHADLLESLPRSGTQKRQILAFILGLSNAPTTPGDYTEPDPSSGRRQVKIVGGYEVIYRLDDPVRAVMILGIREADRVDVR